MAKNHLIKLYYFWEVYSTMYEMGTFISFMEQCHNQLWEFILAQSGDNFIKLPSKKILKIPNMPSAEGIWVRKFLEDEVLELLRMKNIVYPDPMELMDAKKRVYEAYRETPPKN